MYSIDRKNNSIHPLKKKTFSELSFREREHLQEWLANEPQALGDLLIIQKEFASWDGTKERLDLLALDRTGRLVIIENKLDNSGKDVTWQALKYAAYCSTLKTSQIVEIYNSYRGRGTLEEAREIILEFVEGTDGENLNLNPANSQRIILVAAKFRQEVTATALWLIGKGMNITCIQVTPFAKGDDLFLSVDQIIPIPEAGDFMIQLAEKSADEESASQSDIARHRHRRAYWSALLDQFSHDNVALFSNRNTSKDSWLNTGSGISALVYTLVLNQSGAKSLFTLERASELENKAGFDLLFERREQIEHAFGGELSWEQSEGVKSCRIGLAFECDSLDYEQWPDIIAWHQDTITRLERAIQPHLDDISKLL